MNNFRGIALMIFAMAAFAVEDAFIKAAAPTIPVGQILLTLGIVGGGGFSIIAARRGVRVISSVLLTPAVIVRNLSEIAGTIGFVLAITLIPLATASAVAQAMPLVITLAAALIFGETVGWRRWTAIFVGLAGVLVILRPGMEGFDPNALWVLVTVFGLAARDLAARAVPARVSHMQLATYGLLTTIPAGLILLPFTGGLVMPDGRSALLLLGAVLVGGVAYYAITSAARTGEVAVVTPFRYSRIVFALIIGMAVFGEMPDALTLSGATLIVGSGIYTLLRERRLARERSRAEATA